MYMYLSGHVSIRLFIMHSNSVVSSLQYSENVVHVRRNGTHELFLDEVGLDEMGRHHSQLVASILRMDCS